MLTVISLAGEEPVTPAEVKLAARVDNDLGATSSLDPLIAALITTAREQAEQLTQRCYRPQVRRVELGAWPVASQVLPVHRATQCAVKYWSGADLVELAGAAYGFAPGGPGGIGTLMAPAVGTDWPVLGARAVGPLVQIDLTAGPEAPAEVPGCVKTFITASVAAWLKAPEAIAAAALGPHPLFECLLNGEKTYG